MSDHPNETGLDGTPAPAEKALHNPDPGIFGTNPDRLEVFDLDDFLSNAKRVTRTATLCMDGTLDDEYRQALEELAALVDEEGNPVAGEAEASLEDRDRIGHLEARVRDLLDRRRKSSRAIIFEAMPSDEYEVIEDKYITNAKTRDINKAGVVLITSCAIQPKITEDGLAKLRKQLNKAQWIELTDAAFYVNTMGGTTIPKLPSYLPTLGQGTSS